MKKHELPVVDAMDTIAARCPYFGRCGGCSLQHRQLSDQVALKQRYLEEMLWQYGANRAQMMLAPVSAQPWGYREKARLSVRYLADQDKVLIGFHQKNSSFVLDMDYCAILPQRVNQLLPDLSHTIYQLSIRHRLPQVEVAVGDQVLVLVLRILLPLNEHDQQLLRQFAERQAIQLWLQPQGPDSAQPFHPLAMPPLDYAVPESQVTLPFRPTDFTQINRRVNRVMIQRAMQLLQPVRHDCIGDFFCGLGNFTLPLARSGAQVIGFEGSEALVARARQNASLNLLQRRTWFVQKNLFETTARWLAGYPAMNKMLLDPPREGAIALIKSLPAVRAPQRIVYISCNPVTLARDAQVLTRVKGYVLKAAGVINLFPHTNHVESIVWFEKKSTAAPLFC